MKRLLVATLLAGTALVPASAQTTQSFEYDALGRLTKATPSSGTPVCYTYNPADNRTNVSAGCTSFARQPEQQNDKAPPASNAPASTEKKTWEELGLCGLIAFPVCPDGP